MSEVAVVILNFNGENYLKQFLPALREYNSIGYEIVVADNASTDGSIKIIESFPNVRLIRIEDNLGFAGGYNRALAEISADYTVLLNSDVEVAEAWIEPIISFMESNPNTAACQPKLRAFDNKSSFEYAGASGGFLDKYGFPFCRGRVFSHVEYDDGQYDAVKKVFWATGACMVIRTSLYKELGGLDDRFFAHMEEIDLCWRINAAGYDIFCVPESKVYHVGGGTLAAGSPRKVYLNFRNSLLMLYKNLSLKDFKKKYRFRIFFDFLAVINFFVTFQWNLIPTIFNAHQDFLRMKSNYILNDREKENLLEEREITLQKSVVWEYFLKRKKVFSRLFDQK